MVLHTPELLVMFIVSLIVFLFHKNFDFPTVRLDHGQFSKSAALWDAADTWGRRLFEVLRFSYTCSYTTLRGMEKMSRQ